MLTNKKHMLRLYQNGLGEKNSKIKKIDSRAGVNAFALYLLRTIDGVKFFL